MAINDVKKVLLVEDDRDISHLVKLHLEDEGYSVDIAADGIGGLAKAQGQAYDLVVLDLMLPGMDGLEICQRLRGEMDYVPILMLTATARQQHNCKKQPGGGPFLPSISRCLSPPSSHSDINSSLVTA
ncbi:response regulator [bacterium]|nr:response regulator [bacterium]